MNNRLRIVLWLCLLMPLVAKAQDMATEEKIADTQASVDKPKKLVDSATINLRTTVTGSQEQPRVLYIMPWQSPAAEELEIEMLSSQQDAVFGHVEREEMLRGLESAGEFDDTKDN